MTRTLRRGQGEHLTLEVLDGETFRPVDGGPPQEAVNRVIGKLPFRKSIEYRIK